jgi:hypothetical protein
MFPNQPALEQEKQREQSPALFQSGEHERNSIVIYEWHQAYQRNLTPWYTMLIYQLSTDDFTEVMNGPPDLRRPSCFTFKFQSLLSFYHG